MHLINIGTLKLEEFIEGSIPEYAILSHRWSDEELTFKDVVKARASQKARGYNKLVKACETASRYEVDYLWIDTCCIDKRSSAELSEAINSMFAWYKNAKACIVYLQDVDISRGGRDRLERAYTWTHHIGQSEWFTRSWTLQELIAPKALDFYSRDWEWIASNTGVDAALLSEVTGISAAVILKQHSLSEVPIAERMSWAANRRATRSEAMSYSLMGIFDVNMALLYGEGSKAFSRLQEEIIRRTQDPTFLIWGHGKDDCHKSQSHQLLANSPEDFSKARSTIILSPGTRRTFAITNIGLDIEVEIIRLSLETYSLVVGRDIQFAVFIDGLSLSANCLCRTYTIG